MNDRFDELAKDMAQSLTRRRALKQFSLGLAGLALASLGLANKTLAAPKTFHCNCKKTNYGCERYVDFGGCTLYCSAVCSPF